MYCKKCRGRVFVDRVFSSYDHLEIFCINCGFRKMFHPPSQFGKAVQWLHQTENQLMKKANGK